jgi:hypothetical protein
MGWDIGIQSSGTWNKYAQDLQGRDVHWLMFALYSLVAV